MPPNHEDPADSDSDNEYEVTVRAVQGGFETTDSITILVHDVVELPTFDQASCTPQARCSVTVTEEALGEIQQITASSNGGGGLTWEVTNQNNSDYVVVRDSAGKLVFESGNVPDYEDSDFQPKFVDVDVRVTNDDGSATAYIRVNVQNAQEAGTVELDNYVPTPSDDVSASLTDPDGLINGLMWQWQYTTSDSNTGWTDISGATDSVYEVTLADVGRRLRGVASYNDGAGGGTQTAASQATAKVVNRAPSMNLTTYG